LVRFYTGDFAKAAEDFKQVVDQQPSSYSVIMLYLSRAREDRGRATAELQKLAGKLDSQAWPYPIVEL
jgi:lipoprotein NlpI